MPGKSAARRRFDRWTKCTEWPMALTAIIFTAVYAYVVIGNLRLTEIDWPEHVMDAVWVVFAVHYLVSLVLAPNTGRWFITHLHELAIVLLPPLRSLRMLRLVTLISALRRTAGSALRGKVTVYVVFTSLLLVLVSALAILDAEQNAVGSNITNFGDAVWWSLVTITTVGYGDHYPVTEMGRIIAAGLMICGLGLIGSVTAAVASWFVEKIQETKHEDEEQPA